MAEQRAIEEAQVESKVPIEKWRQFEKDVAAMNDDHPGGGTVLWNQTLQGQMSGKPRQIDVLIDGEIKGHSMKIAVECKHYAKPVGIHLVEQFAGMLADVGVDCGVLYTVNGLTTHAEARLKNNMSPNITHYEIEVITPEMEPYDYNFDEVFRGFGDCPAVNCRMGTISWGTYSSNDGDTIKLGDCDRCGATAVECTECEEITGGDEACFCGSRYTVRYDRDAVQEPGVNRTAADGTQTIFDQVQVVDHPM